MKIKIINPELCETCLNRTCAFVDARMKEQFYSLKTETSVCPKNILEDGTKPSSFREKCINCALCVKSCYADNLKIVDYIQDFGIVNLNEIQYNAIALSYLDKITGFAANTNRNRSLNFDGFLQTSSGESCFVEVDYNNDSLECCRRLLGAFITYEGNIGPIRNGLIVLQEFPREGSRDIFNVIEKLTAFPTTKDCRIFFCTFSMLRHMMLKLSTKNACLSDLFYNPNNLKGETIADYQRRITKECVLISSNHKPQSIPMYSLRAACGRFEEVSHPEMEGWVDASGHGFTPDEKCHFVVRAKGNSMSPKIKDGDLCVFEWYTGGSRNGEIVLTQSNEFDPEYDGKYTIKKYVSEKENNEDGSWEHTMIQLQSLNPQYPPINLEPNDAEQYRTIGIFKTVL